MSCDICGGSGTVSADLLRKSEQDALEKCRPDSLKQVLWNLTVVPILFASAMMLGVGLVFLLGRLFATKPLDWAPNDMLYEAGLVWIGILHHRSCSWHLAKLGR